MNLVRFIELDAGRADQARRTVPATISTEFAVNRGGYREVLLHGPENVDLSRAPLPLIESHDGSTLNIGTVEGLQVAGRKLRGNVRFGNTTRAQELWADVRDGIVRNLSVGYRVDDYTMDGDTQNVTRWTPHEVSLVAVPADPSAGLNRAHPQPFSSTQSMNDLTPNQPAPDAGEHLSRSQRRAMNAPDPATLAVEAERNRVADINANVTALANFDGMRSLGDKAIAEGWNDAQFRKEALQLMASKPGRMTAVDVRNRDAGPRGERQYSIARALRSMIDPRSVDAGFERERSQEIAHQCRREPRGIYIPMGELSTRDLTVAGAPALVGTQHLGGSFIDALRVRSVVMNLNPMVLPGLTADVSIPRLATASTAYWIAGDGADAVTASAPGFDALTLTPKTVGALVNLSRKMVLQADPAAEDVVKNDLAKVIANALDLAALQGTGSTNQPTGIVNTAGVTTASFAAATPTFAEIVAMEGALESVNADASRAAYVTTPALASTLKTTQKASTGDEMIWEAGAQPGVGVVNGLDARFTPNVPAKKVILGNWSDLVIAMWGGIDLEVNPYADFAKGIVSVRAFASIDLGVRHAPSFAVYTTL